MKLTTLSLPKLKKLRARFNNFLYAAGINVALDDVESRQTFAQFILDIRVAITWQVQEILKPENFDRLMEVSKMRIRYYDNKKLEAVFNNLFSDLDLRQAFIEHGENTIGFYFRWGADLGGQSALDKLGIEGVFGVTNEAWLDFLEDAENLLIRSVDNTTKDWLAAMIKEGLDNQLTVSEMRDMIETEAKGMTKHRAETIARTEIANVMSQTELESYRRAGYKKKRWRTSRDDRVCPICAPADNEEVPVGSLFSTGTDAPPAHPNCRCFIQAVLDFDWDPVENKMIWFGD